MLQAEIETRPILRHLSVSEGIFWVYIHIYTTGYWNAQSMRRFQWNIYIHKHPQRGFYKEAYLRPGLHERVWKILLCSSQIERNACLH